MKITAGSRVAVLAVLLIAGTATAGEQFLRPSFIVIEQVNPEVHTQVRVANSSPYQALFIFQPVSGVWQAALRLAPGQSWGMSRWTDLAGPLWSGSEPIYIWQVCLDTACDPRQLVTEVQTWGKSGWIAHGPSPYQMVYGYQNPPSHTILFPKAYVPARRRVVIYGPYSGVVAYDSDGAVVATIGPGGWGTSVDTYMMPDTTAFAVVTAAPWEPPAPQPLTFTWGLFNTANAVEILP